MRFKDTNVFGFSGALRGMRNPLNSWDKSDSSFILPFDEDEKKYPCDWEHYHIGEEDMKLAKKLIAAGGEHRKFLRMIHVQTDVDMPRYWWSEADTYHFGTKNSCSTMHKLLNNNNPITKDLFISCPEDDDVLSVVVKRLESLRKEYKNSDDKDRLLLRAKRLLPEGFVQLRTWDTNYEELRNMYHQRKNHRLKKEWCEIFCDWVESLPYAEEFICSM